MEVVVGALQLDGFVPHRGLNPQFRPPVKLDESRLAGIVDQPEAVHAEALDHAQRPRDGAVRHRPHQHVHRLGRELDEVVEGVVGAAGLWKAAVRLHLHRVDQVGELDRILDEEHRDVVADDVPIAFLRVELDGEAAHVAWRVDRAGTAGDGGKAREHRGLHADFAQHLGARVFGERLRQLEIAVRTGAAGVDDPLGNALVVEVADLLAQHEVFEQGRPAGVGLQRILVVRDRDAVVGRQGRVAAAARLMDFTALAGGGAVVGRFLLRGSLAHGVLLDAIH